MKLPVKMNTLPIKCDQLGDITFIYTVEITEGWEHYQTTNTYIDKRQFHNWP